MIKNLAIVLFIISSCSSSVTTKVQNHENEPKSQQKDIKDNLVFGRWALDSMTYLGKIRPIDSSKEIFFEYLSDYRYFAIEKNKINEKSMEIGTYELNKDTLKVFTKKGNLMQKQLFRLKDNKLVLVEIDLKTNTQNSLVFYLTKNNTDFLDTDF